MQTPFLKLDGLVRRFGERTAVDGLTVEIARGEVFGFLGPNGAGKTTTFHLLTGLLAADGGRILVGRGADRNDELTFQVARGSDLWLHARDVPGAHVILLLQPGRAPTEQALLDAATLAAHHSNARGEAQVDVGYTLRKHVRKPPKSRPGTVTYSGLKTIRVRLEPERLTRLLASAARDGD